MKIFIHWLISALAIIISAYLLPGVSVQSFLSALVLAVVLGAINGFIRLVLIVLTLPLTIVTLGLFLIVLNTLHINREVIHHSAEMALLRDLYLRHA